MKNLLLVSSVWIVGALQPASGQSIYSTGFEAPLLQAGLPLVGQDGWVAGLGPVPFFLSDNAAVVTGDKPRIGKQSVRVLGADLVHQPLINQITGGYYDAIGSYRHAVNFDTEGTKVVTVSAYVLVDGKKTPRGNDFFSAGTAARGNLANGDHAGVGELVISSDGHVYGSSGNEDVPTFQTSTRVELGKWHRLAIVIDFGARTYSFLVDQEFQGKFAFDMNNFDENGVQIDYTNVLRRGALLASAAPDAGTLKKANYAAYFDQFAISAKAKRDHDDHDDRDDREH